jgi:lipopolysaccharide exporter
MTTTPPAETESSEGSETNPGMSSTRRLARTAVRSTVWVTLGTYLNQLIGFVSILVMTRLLTPEIFGWFSLATFWSTLLSVRTKLGLNYAAIRQPVTDGKLMGTYTVLEVIAAVSSFVLSIVTGLILLAVGTASEVVTALIVLVTVECIGVLAYPFSMALEKELQVSRLTLVGLIAATVAYVIAIGLALAGAGLWSLLAVNIVTSAISIVGIYRVCRQRYPQVFHFKWRYDRAVARRLLADGVPTGLSLAALGNIVTQFDNFLIGTFVSYTTLGYYDRAYRIAHWPNLLLTMVITRIGFLTFARLQDDLPRLTHAVRLSFWVLTTLGVPMALFLFFGAPDVVRVLYGPGWSESAYFLRFLTIYSLLWPFVNIGFWLAVASGQRRTIVVLTATQAALLIVLGVPFTLQWGAQGTLLAVGITMIVAFAMSTRYVFGRVPLTVREVYAAPLAALVISLLSVALVYTVPAWSTLPAILRLVLTAFLGSGIYLLVLFVMRPQEMRERVRYVRGLLWPKSAAA